MQRLKRIEDLGLVSRKTNKGASKFLIIFLTVFLGGLYFSCGKAQGFIRIDPSHPWSFVYDNGARYFPMGDTCYSLAGQSIKDIQSYIDSRSAHKFNFIRMMAITRGNWPFGGSPSYPDFSTINETAMQKLDWIFDYAASKNMNIELIIWGYGGEWAGGTGMWGNTQYENLWVDKLVNRYKGRQNLFIWTVTNEFERYPLDDYVYHPVDVDWARRIAAIIRSIDLIHPVGVHPSTWISNGAMTGTAWSTYNGFTQRKPQVVWPLWDGSAVNVNSIQNNQGAHDGTWSGGITYHPVTWHGVYYPITWTAEGWDFEGAGMEDSIAEDRSKGKPTINLEFGYQYETGVTDPTRQMHTPDATRKKAWKIVTAGGFFAAGFANAAVQFNNVTNYRPQYLETLCTFFTTKTEYWKMSPRLDLVAPQNVCLALPGTEYVIYLTRGGTDSVYLGAGTYNVEWLNPRTGTYTSGPQVTGGATRTFTAADSNDWVLHLAAVTSPPTPAPMNSLPGKIEAENYRTGGEGIGYHDTASGNIGGAYRSDDVDIQASSDTGGGYNLGWIASGEWLAYDMNVTASGIYNITVRVASPKSTGSFHIEVDGVNKTGTIAVPNTGGWQSWTNITATGISLTGGNHTLKIVIDGSDFNLNYIDIGAYGTTPPPTPTPMNSLPGKIEAENYRTGGEGIGYHDTASGNIGGAYRSDDVDIQASSDTGGGYNLGWIASGEWLAYDMNVTASGIYNITVRVASPKTTGSFHIEVDGVNKTGTIAVPNTGGWQSWTNVTATGISLTGGNHTLKIVIDGSDFNLNYIDIGAYGTTPPPTLTPMNSLPGKIEAENYRTGGEGIGYHDTASGNIGGAYRSDDVDIQACSDTGGGYNVGWIASGEWLGYDVNVTASGIYNITVRVASPKTTGSFHIEVDGVNKTGTIAVPNTGGWQSWTNVTATGISLTGGNHTLKIVIDGSSF